MDLFSDLKKSNLSKAEPLAARMRPTKLADILGQEEILASGKLLRRAIETDNLSSVIFYGPPGTGKTTVASVIAKSTNKRFAEINAVTSGKEDIRRLINEASDNLALYNAETIVFIDEIHRFNKMQQDALLPAVEKGIITLIGATTENPYFYVNSALVSRSLIFELKPLKDTDILKLLTRALNDRGQGLGNYRLQIDQDALEHLSFTAQGDARIALNALELAVLSTPPNSSGVRVIDLSIIEESIQKPKIIYDKSGDQHYDVISAFIKSMRGSDPDATLHYLARMLEAGEDPRFIARRILVHASEDVGLADPMALVLAQAALETVNFVGLPEGRLALAQAALYIALAPKSNQVLKSIDMALDDVRKGKVGPVPKHLRNAHYSGVQQTYLPQELLGRKYFLTDKNDS